MLQSEQPSKKKIGGWIIVVIIGFSISLFDILLYMFKDLLPFFTDGTWEAISTYGSESYDAHMKSLFIFEVIGNVIIAILSGLSLFLIFKKSKFAPIMAIGCLIWPVVFSYIERYAIMNSYELAEQSVSLLENDLSRSLLQAIIWVPYFLLSKRVKETFYTEKEVLGK